MTSLLASLVLVGCSEAPPPCTPDIAAWMDEDGDGWGGEAVGKVCKLGEKMVEVAQDCDDANAQLNPDAVEVCDGIDNDCDGKIDDDANLRQFWYDHDGDGYGGLYRSELSCQKPGEEWVTNDLDCDDDDAAVNPDGQEVCGRVDEDCDGYVDESDDSVDPASFSTFFADKDNDGYGDQDDTMEGCRLVPGYVLNADDCDDDSAAITQAEYYEDRDGDGYGDPDTLALGCRNPPPGTVDNALDCDDDDPTLLYESDWFEDPDGDGYGSGGSLAFDCVSPAPYAVMLGGDCDESDPNENPGSPEDCSDGIDNNCNFLVDDDDPGCLPPCADDVVVTSYAGSTSGQGNDFSPSCMFSNADDYTLAFTATSSKSWTFSLQGSSYDTGISIYDGCGGVQLACNDDWWGVQSQVQVFLTEGQIVIVNIDGYSSNSGNFTLNVF